jgi:hypothetical protein
MRLVATNRPAININTSKGVNLPPDQQPMHLSPRFGRQFCKWRQPTLRVVAKESVSRLVLILSDQKGGILDKVQDAPRRSGYPARLALKAQLARERQRNCRKIADREAI